MSSSDAGEGLISSSDATSSDASSSDATSSGASDNVRYAIIQIDNGKITVLDTSNESFASGKPSELLEQKTSSIFAIKITKKDCTETAGIKCIEYGGAKYELDLETAVTKEEAETKLIDEDFLASTATVPASESKVPESGPEVSESNKSVTESNTSTSKPIGEYTKEDVIDFFETNASAFSDFLNNSDNNKFGEINYLKIAESVVRNKIQDYGVEICQNLMSEAAAYAWSIIDNSTTNTIDDKQFSEILTAFEILHVVDPSNNEKKNKIDTINKIIN